MKRIPFKCEFGHVTIKEFSSNQSTPSLIVCEKCKEEATAKMIRYEHPHNDKNYIHAWPSKELIKKYIPEMAVRF